ALPSASKNLVDRLRRGAQAVDRDQHVVGRQARALGRSAGCDVLQRWMEGAGQRRAKPSARRTDVRLGARSFPAAILSAFRRPPVETDTEALEQRGKR